MREYRSSTGKREIYYTPADVDNIMSGELMTAGLNAERISGERGRGCGEVRRGPSQGSARPVCGFG